MAIHVWTLTINNIVCKIYCEQKSVDYLKIKFNFIHRTMKRTNKNKNLLT